MKKVYIIGKDSVPPRTVLEKGEKLEMILLVLPGTSCEVPLELSLEGEDAELDLYGLYLCPSDERVSFDVDLRHESNSCRSSQLFKGIVGGTADASFHGLIYVSKGAQKTKASQQNNNILLSKGAKASTKPQLEIYADDVECSHGATVGYLDENELFYMRSRGIPEAEARRFQMISFISPVLERIEENSLRETVLESLNSLFV